MSQLTPEQLQDLQKTHLDFLERYYADILVAGVPVLRCINYKTIQVVNSLGLGYLLQEAGDNENTGIE